MVLVTRQAPDFTAAAVLGNGEIVDNFNFKQHIAGKAAVVFSIHSTLLSYAHLNLSRLIIAMKSSKNVVLK